MSFRDRVVLITGASSGIGWVFAKQFGEIGARVGLIARRKERLEELANEIRGKGGTALTIPADVAEREQIKAALAELRTKLGPVDLLVANAGVGYASFADQSNIAQIERMIRVNLLGVVYSIEAVLPEMLARRQGHLAAVSSLAGYRGLPGESGYCATKAAVTTYMEGLRVQLRELGIDVTTICPGFVHTPMTAKHKFKLPWVMNADRAAQRIVGGLERKVKVLNFPWQMTLVMKAARWAPDWLIEWQMRKYYQKTLPRDKNSSADALVG